MLCGLFFLLIIINFLIYQFHVVILLVSPNPLLAASKPLMVPSSCKIFFTLFSKKKKIYLLF
ncbi:MAG: hypothetical protein DF280_01360 ['Brassica napus' phytoplasma]|nr:MAG: hypothetical protein DF280_01360 ['Brassica napus' phytoplasma]